MQRHTDYLMTGVAAEVLGVSRNTLPAWVEKEKFPMRRNPAKGYQLFRRSDLETLLRKTGTPVNRRRTK